MADNKKKFIVSLEIETKTAEQQIKASGKDIEKILANIGKASDKVTYFKGLVEEIANVDRQLSDFKNKFGDAMFNEMFGNFNLNIEGQLKETLGLTKQQLTQLDELYNKKSKIQQTLDAVNNKPIKIDTTIENDVEIINKLIEDYKTATQKWSSTISNPKSSTDDVNKVIAERVRIATLLANTSDYVIDYGSDDGAFTASNEAVDEAREYLEKFHASSKNVINQIKQDFNGLVNNINNDIKKVMAGPKNQSNVYNELHSQLQKYLDLQKQLADEDISDADFDKVSEDIVNIEKEISALGELENKVEDVKKIFTTFNQGGIADEDLFDEIRNTLGVEIPKQAQNTEAAFDQVGKHIIEATEYVKGLEAAIRNMFSEASKASNIEYKILINGQDIDARGGIDGEVPLKTSAEAYLANLTKDIDIDAHSHQGKSANINMPDLKSAINKYYGGLTKMSAIVGDKDILTLDLTKVKIEDAFKALGKVQEVINKSKLQTISPEKFNQIFSSIDSSYTDIAKKWEPAKFGELAQYIYDVKQSSEQVITPLERFKNLLMTTTGGKIDLSKYTEEFNNFSVDNVEKLFNKIMKLEGVMEDGKILQVDDKVTQGSIENITKDIQRQKDEFLELRQTAKLTYDDIRAEVEKYLSATKSDESFFNKFYHPEETEKLRADLSEASAGYLDINSLTNRIAGDFGIEPKELNLIQEAANAYDDIDEDLVRENGLLEDKLELLREIADEYGSQVTDKKRERYEELNQKDMNDGLTSKEEERFSDLGDEIMEADESLERFGETYDKIIVKFHKGKDKEILPDDKGLRDLFKYSDSISYDEFGGKEIKDVIFVRKQEQEVIEQTNQELKEQVQIQKQLNEAGDNSEAIVQQKKLESALEDVESQAKETADAVDKIGEGSKSVDELRQMYDTLKAAHDALPRRKIEEPDSYKYDWEKAKRYADFEYDGEDLIPWNLSLEDALNAQENLMNRSREAIKSTYKQIRQMQSAINKHGGHLGDEVYDEADIENAKEGLMGLFEKYYEISGDLDTLDVKMTKPFQALLEQTKSEIAEREVQKKAYDAETEEIIANNRAQIASFEELHRTTRKAFEASKSKDPKYEYAWAQLPDIYTGINGDEYTVFGNYDSFESNLKRMGIEIPQAAEKAEQAIEEMSHTDATPKIDSSFKSDLQEIEKQAKENTEALKEEKAAQESLNQEKKEARIDTDDTAAEAKENAEAKEKEAAAHEHNADAIKKENAAKAAETDESSIDELADLEKLEEKIKQIKEAVELKTQAFREEGDVVSSVVKQELDALDTLSKYLDTIRVTINDIVDGLNKINNTKLNDVTDDKSQTVVDNDSTQPNINREWALETTLIQTNTILERIARAVESNEDTTGLITGLEHTIKDLRDAANAIKVNANDFKQKAKDDVKDTSSNDSKDTKKQKTFDEIKSDTVGSFEKYRKDVESSIHITDEFKSKLDNLQLELANAGDTNGLNIWKQNLSDFQNEFGRYEDASKNILIGQINNIKKEAKDAMKGLDLDIPTDDPEKRAKQEAIAQGFKDIQIESDICTSKVKSNQSAEIDALNATKKQLLENIHVYKQENDLLNSGGKSGKNYGSTAIIRETTRRNQLQAYADEVNPGFKDSKTFKLYIDAYDKLIQKRNELMSKPVLTDRDVQEFNDAKAAAAGYGKELDKMVAKANKLEGNHFKSSTIGSDIKIDDGLGRKQALTDFVTQMHDANDATIKFSNNYRECTFRMKNSDGTWTKMSAVLDETSNKMYSTAGEVTKYGTAIGEFVGALKGEFLKLGRYMIASFSFMEMIQVVRKGITYIKEIDDALTDLKKVTNETDAGYDRFLQTMSKTASVVGSTVAELTTMAAEWARLGYNMAEAADLAESTAILLNVSEFEDATQASEALISTIQAFGYAAEESMDVVDIMNEIGNNYAISSDGIATALQDSASALMAGGNSMEEATAMIAAANKVVQDPNQVGSGLRTISLRLRGTSVSGQLEELGEDTEGLVSASKMRDKIKGLAGVDILTDTGAYKSTYEIIREIGDVWADMNDMDQAALLELMAGKNRSNIMAALLTNTKDLKKALDDAQNAEGSAYRENQAYLDSIQGRVDLFMNALQTFWMNLISSDVIKWVVDQGTALIKFLDTTQGKLTAGTAAVLAFLKAVKGFGVIKAGFEILFGIDSKDAQGLADVFKKLKTTLLDLIQAEQRQIQATDKSTASELAESEANKKSTATELTETEANKKVTASEIAEDVANKKVAASEEAENLANEKAILSESGESAQNVAGGASKKGLGTLGTITLTLTAAALLSAALDKIIVNAQEASEKTTEGFNEISDAVSVTKSNVEGLEEELNGDNGINKQIAELEGKNLSFVDDQELQRLKSQKTALEHNLSIQKDLLKSQEKVKSERAVAAMKDFVKASNEGAESATKTGKAIGALLGGALMATGIVGTYLSGGSGVAITGSMVAKGAAMVAGGAIVGRKVGEESESKRNAATVNTYEDWYKTYADAYQKKSQAAEAARAKYEKDAGNMDKYDEWQELEQEALDVQSKMYDNLTQMQNYYSGIQYGQSEALDKELDTWYNFLDKMNIAGQLDGTVNAGAKVNAIDRIFGENASDEVKAFRKEIDEALKEENTEFDIAAEIEGRDDLQELEEQLKEIGITTDEVSDYFRKTGEIGTQAFSDLSGEIKAAETAMTKLQTVLGKNTNEGYETRNTGLEEMKDLMAKGAIGSESNLWNIAEAMGFTYDSAKSIEANADALYDFIKVRDDWYQVDEDGEWGVSSANAFAQDIENAVKNSEKLQELKVKWDFDESTGTLDFDFNNMKFDKIVEALGETKEAAGLTNDEFIDMLKHLGQFYNVQWASGNDIVSYLKSLEDTSLSVKDKLAMIEDPLNQLLRKQGLNPDEIKDYLTGGGTLEKLPEDLGAAVKAYQELHKEVEKSSKEEMTLEDAQPDLKSGNIEKKQGGKLDGALTIASILSMLGLGKFGKGKDAGNILKGPANSLDNKGLLSSLLGGLSLGKGKGISSLLGKGKNLLGGLLGKGALKGGLGVLGKGALKVGSKFLGPAGWVASALTTIGPMITKQFSKGGGKGLLSGLFGKIGQGLSKISPKGLLAGLGLGATGLGASSLFGKFSGKKSDTDIGVSANIDGDVENLAVFTESVKELSKLDKNITTEVTANVNGNVTDFLMFEERLDNLKVFADSAKGLKNIGTIYSEVTANVDGNVVDTFEYKINNLKTFVDSAKGIQDVGIISSKVTADVEGNVFDTLELTIDNLKTYVDSANGIKDVEGNISSKITANVDGNVFDTFEGTINNLKTYIDSAEGIKDIEGNITSKITADVDGTVFTTFEGTINNLKTYVDSANGIKDIEGNIASKITADVDGTVFTTFESTINNLKTYVDSAQGIKDFEGEISSKIIADIDGNVFDTFEVTLDNLKTYVDSANGIKDIKGNISSKITADIDGSVFKEYEMTIDNLKEYVTSAQGIKDIEGNISSKVTADIDGNVFDTVEMTIDNLKKYVDSAQGIKDIEGNITSKITADIDGTVFTEYETTIDNLDEYISSAEGIKEIEGNISSKVTADIDGTVFTTAEVTIDNLKKYVDSAKGIKDIEGNISSKVTADIEGNLTDDGIEKLKKFSGIATTLKSIASIAIKVTAEIATEAINNALTLLQKVKDGGLFTDHEATVMVDADTTLATTAIQDINTTTLDDKTLKISETGSQTVLNKLDTINNKTLNSKTVTINYKTGTLPSLFGGLLGGFGLFANGTAHANGTAYAGGNWGASKTETALVGELGPELLVRNGRWTTIGDNGAEFASIQKGDIIFNHRQTEELLKNGYVTSGGGRGKAYASGTAYSSGGGKYREWTFDDGTNSVKTSSSSKSSSSKKSSSKEYSDDFEEIFDWFEVRMEEIHEDLDLMAAKLENAITLSSKNNILDSMIATNKEQLTTLEKGVKLYEEYANDLLYEIPSAYRSEAKDGKIAIEDFAGAADEKTLEAIENYREWAQKVADLKVQLQETQKEMAKLAKQKFDNIYEEYDFKANIEDKQNEKLQSAIDYDEESGYITSEKYYKEMMKNTQQQAEYLIAARNKMQKSLDESVRKGSKNGGFDKNSDEWKDAIEQMYDIDLAIDECTLELEEFQNAINDIYWDNFDELTERLENISDETDNLINLMGKVEKPVITPETDDGWSSDEVAWSDEGLAQLGLYAQKMEIAEYQAKKYEEAIDELNSQYAAGRYSESEYLEKLDELKDGQYDAIDAYHEAQEAMVDLNKARVDAIKEGIEKEIDAYEELIDKKQEELDAEKDLYDFQKSVMEQKKDISDIERQLAALSGDNSASARAKRKQLEAELAEANAALEETYYERSLEDKQTGLDKEFETLQKEKEAEIEQWEKYLEDIKTVVADTLSVVQANGFNIYDTLQEKAKEYNLTLSDYLLNPWEDGALAIDRYANNFGDAVSSTTDELNKLESGWQGAIDAMDKAASAEISTQNKENATYGAAEYVAPKPEPKPTTPKPTPTATDSIKVGGKINAKGAKIYDYAGDTSGETQYFSSDPIYKVLQEKNGYLQVRWHKLSKGVTGWFKKSDVKAYAKGSKKIDKDQLALIDELGEELVIHAQGGRLAYLSKGSGVVPADLTSNLMDWGELNPQDILDKNRPSVGINPAVHNTEINLNIQYGDMLRIENFKGDNPDEIAKIVAKQFEKHTKDLNNSLRKYVR